VGHHHRKPRHRGRGGHRRQARPPGPPGPVRGRLRLLRQRQRPHRPRMQCGPHRLEPRHPRGRHYRSPHQQRAGSGRGHLGWRNPHPHHAPAGPGRGQRGVRSRFRLRRRRSHRARRAERGAHRQPQPRLSLGPPRPAQRRPDRRLPGCGPRRLGRERPLRRRPVPRRLPGGHRRRRHRLPRPARVLLRVRTPGLRRRPGRGRCIPVPLRDHPGLRPEHLPQPPGRQHLRLDGRHLHGRPARLGSRSAPVRKRLDHPCCRSAAACRPPPPTFHPPAGTTTPGGGS
jgi:hypothetical protein